MERCQYPACLNGLVANSNYCLQHKERVEFLTKDVQPTRGYCHMGSCRRRKASGSNYCDRHLDYEFLCLTDGCFADAIPGTEACELHTNHGDPETWLKPCPHYGCGFVARPGMAFCDRHSLPERTLCELDYCSAIAAAGETRCHGHLQPPAPAKHSHYYKSVKGLDTIDVYRVLQLFNVTDPCVAHAVKKLLVAGGRGAGKDINRDIQEAIDSLQRYLEIKSEDADRGAATS